MVVNYDIKNLTGITKGNNAYIVFEKRDTPNNSDGVYFQMFDLNSNIIPDPTTIPDTANKIIDSSVYNNVGLERIYLYVNNDGSQITVVIVAEPFDGTRHMYTGRIVNGNYTACEDTPTEITGELRKIFGFYFNNNEKIKVYTYFDGKNEVWGGEGH